ncbi:hypothetical protein, partial [uncultured Maribacter sp.]|uniref:hypothetical protein n=1 Tax=uncultured Maribacter sp. TaxID=431308 RepID=UPI002638BCF5
MMKTLLYYRIILSHNLSRIGTLSIIICMLLLGSYNLFANDNEKTTIPSETKIFAVVDGGTISGGPFTFCVGDGEADYAKGVSLECNSTV